MLFQGESLITEIILARGVYGALLASLARKTIQTADFPYSKLHNCTRPLKNSGFDQLMSSGSNLDRGHYEEICFRNCNHKFGLKCSNNKKKKHLWLMTNWGMDLITIYHACYMSCNHILIRSTPWQQNSHWNPVSSTLNELHTGDV